MGGGGGGDRKRQANMEVQETPYLDERWRRAFLSNVTFYTNIKQKYSVRF